MEDKSIRIHQIKQIIKTETERYKSILDLLELTTDDSYDKDITVIREGVRKSKKELNLLLSITGTKGYTVRYFIEDDVVGEENYCDKDKAITAAKSFDCVAFEECDTDEQSLCAEVIDKETNETIYWVNSEGEEGEQNE